MIINNNSLTNYFKIKYGENICGKSWYQADIILELKYLKNLHFKIVLNNNDTIIITPLVVENNLKINDIDLKYAINYFLRLNDKLSFFDTLISFTKELDDNSSESEYETDSENEDNNNITQNIIEKTELLQFLICFTGFEKNEEFENIKNSLVDLNNIKILEDFDEYLDSLNPNKILICKEFSNNIKILNSICKKIPILNLNFINKLKNNKLTNIEESDYINKEIYDIHINRKFDKFCNKNIFIYKRIKPDFNTFKRLFLSLGNNNIKEFNTYKEIIPNNEDFSNIFLIDKLNKKFQNFSNVITKNDFINMIIKF